MGSLVLRGRGRAIECCTDGACTRSPYAERSRAAWAVAAACLGPEGRLLGALSGPVWQGSPQTSGCAEWRAIGTCAQAFGGAGTDIHLLSDYLAAVRALKAGPQEMRIGRVSTGARYLAMHQGLRCISQVSKVKAHQDAEARARATPAEAKQARGSEAADAAAKLALAAHPQQAAESDWHLAEQGRQARQVLLLAAHTLPQWPRLRQRGGGAYAQGLGQLERVQGTTPGRLTIGHDWAHRNGT